MRTMHPVLKRGGLYWDRDLLPPRAYEARFARIQARIGAAGDDAWLVFGDVERYGSLAYFSNFLPRTRSALALVPRSGAPSLLISVGQRDVPAAKTLTWIDDVRPFTRLPRTLVALIEEKGLSRARIGLVSVEELLSVKDWSDIAAALPGVQWTRCTDDLAALRASKDEWEREALRRVADVVAGGLDLCASLLKPGRAMRHVTADIERHIRAHAAEDVRILCAGGPQTGIALRPPDDRVLQSGDVVMLYVAAEVQRYWAEAARTFVLGRARPELRVLADRCAEALAAMHAAAQIGAPAARLAEAAEAALADTALTLAARSYGFGNGIGLDAEETPVIRSENSGTLAKDSALALRVIAHADGMGVALGESIFVADGKTEQLIAPSPLVECR
jgi:Xaa-Pro aminopeptidase